MKTINRCFILVLLSILFFSHSVFSQITIGANLKPIDGALLDLKEKEDGTSTKGLGLPRIDLISFTSLVPSVDEDAEKLPGVKDAHTGLLVYQAITPCVCRDESLYNGTYVWDGQKWDAINTIKKPEIFYYVDERQGDETHTYPYRKFGDAGYWMLENMRAKLFDHKRDDPVGDPIVNQPTGSLHFDGFYWAYPARTREEGAAMYNLDNKLGLLYSFNVSTNSKTTNQEDNVVQSDPVQGMCPLGWHVPSDLEFTQLEIELSKNYQKYATIQPTVAVSLPALGVIGWRGNIQGNVLRDPCVSANGLDTWIGCSFTAEYGGFNAKSAGISNNGNPHYYGQRAFFRTSSRTERQIGTLTLGVYRSVQPEVPKFSLRCKKNDI